MSDKANKNKSGSSGGSGSDDEDEKSKKISRCDDKFTDVLTKVDARSKGSKARMSEAEKEKLVKELNQLQTKEGGGGAGGGCGEGKTNTACCSDKFQVCKQCKTKCECSNQQKCTLSNAKKQSR